VKPVIETSGERRTSLMPVRVRSAVPQVDAAGQPARRARAGRRSSWAAGRLRRVSWLRLRLPGNRRSPAVLTHLGQRPDPRRRLAHRRAVDEHLAVNGGDTLGDSADALRARLWPTVRPAMSARAHAATFATSAASRSRSNPLAVSLPGVVHAFAIAMCASSQYVTKNSHVMNWSRPQVTIQTPRAL
jgi:hypothetical protein